MECKCKRSFLESLSKKDLVDYLSNKKRIIPIIIGDGGFYMKDRHHLTRALNDADVDDSLKYLTCNVTENWVSHKKFWSRMIEEEHVWLYDEKGLQPVSPLHLPRHADKLVDDPFRSLAWMVRNAGGYGKSDLPFAELMWTNFFRQNIDLKEDNQSEPQETWCKVAPYSEECLPDQEHALNKVFPKAMRLAMSPAADNLPGYGQGELDPADCGK